MRLKTPQGRNLLSFFWLPGVSGSEESCRSHAMCAAGHEHKGWEAAFISPLPVPYHTLKNEKVTGLVSTSFCIFSGVLTFFWDQGSRLTPQTSFHPHTITQNWIYQCIKKLCKGQLLIDLFTSSAYSEKYTWKHLSEFILKYFALVCV